MATIITEDDVCIASLDDLLRRTFHKTEIDKDGDLHITDGLEFPVWVSIDDRQKLICLFTFMRRDLGKHPPS